VQKINDFSKTIRKKNAQGPSVFSFADLFCMKEFIWGKRKRKFMKLSNDIIDKKISLEYLLKYYSNLERLKMILLNDEQQKVFFEMPKFLIEEHVNEVICMAK